MDFEETTMLQRDMQLHNELLLKLDQAWKQDQNEYQQVTSQPEWFKRFKPLTEAFEKELQYLAYAKTPESDITFMTVFSDLTGNLITQTFQLQALRNIANRFASNQGNFQWFIQASASTFDLVGSTNPFFLGTDMYSNFEDTISYEVPNDVRSTTRLSKDERPLKDTQKPSKAGYFFLKRRQWLINYLLAIRFYRTFQSLLPIMEIAKKIAAAQGFDSGIPLPDPDQVSTEIPVSMVTPPAPAWETQLQLPNLG